MAPALDEDEAAVPEAPEETAVAVPVPLELAAVVVVEALDAFLVPQLSRMLVVQFACPVALPTFWLMQLSAAFSQMY